MGVLPHVTLQLESHQGDVTNLHDFTRYSDVIMSAMASQITSVSIFAQLFVQTQIKENTKAPRQWPLCGKFAGDRGIPRPNGQ